MSAAQLATKGSFTDPRMFLVGSRDPRLAIVSDTAVRHEQTCDGPTYLVINSTATDADLLRVHKRFPEFTIDKLRTFRDEQRRAA